MNSRVRKAAAGFMALSLFSSSMSAFAANGDDTTSIAGISVAVTTYSETSDEPEKEIYDYLTANAVPTDSETKTVLSNTVDQADTENLASATVLSVNAGAVAEDTAAGKSGVSSTVGRLNVRKQPTTNADILDTIESNTRVKITGSVTNSYGDWYQISADNLRGYVLASYVLTDDDADSSDVDIANTTATVKTDTTNLLDSASASAKSIGTLYLGEKFTITDIQNGYVKLAADDGYAVGYVSVEDVKLTQSLSLAYYDPEEGAGVFLSQYQQDLDYTKGLYLKQMADEDYDGAYMSASYLVELWGYYIDTATQEGLEQLAEEAKTQQENAKVLLSKAEAKGGSFNAGPAISEDVTEPVEPSGEGTVDNGTGSSTNNGQGEPSGEGSYETVGTTTAPAAPTTEAPQATATTPENQSAPVGASLIGITAKYIGGVKHAGDMIYSSELYVVGEYDDGNYIDIYSGWTSADVGMYLSEGTRVVTLEYQGFTSSLEIAVLPVEITEAPTSAPVINEDPVINPTDSYIEPTETQPATEPQAVPTETQPVTETQPPTETQPAATEAAIRAVYAKYTGGTKHTGDIIYSSELYLVAEYTDGTYQDIMSGWTSPDVGMALTPGTKTVTMEYYGLTSTVSVQVYELEAPTEPVPTETQPQGAQLVNVYAKYVGGAKYAGDMIYSNELYLVGEYSDGTYQDITSGWASNEVGMTLSAGTTIVTMYYGNLASQVAINVEGAAPAPAPTEPAPVATEPVQTQPAVEVSAARANLVAYAMSWVGRANYVWGGANLVDGGQVDCSGFTMNVYARTAGISLPHYSMAQAGYGAQISEAQLKPGDLVVYPGHVAIYIGNGCIVHAKNENVGIVTDSIYFKAGTNPVAFVNLLGD